MAKRPLRCLALAYREGRSLEGLAEVVDRWGLSHRFPQLCPSIRSSSLILVRSHTPPPPPPSHYAHLPILHLTLNLFLSHTPTPPPTLSFLPSPPFSFSQRLSPDLYSSQRLCQFRASRD